MPSDSIVFVVDDDAAVLDSLRFLIESVGLRVRTFSSADEFLAAYTPDQPGCLVLDIRMPGMSGLELQEQLAKRGYTLPVIIITAHGDVPSAVRAMHAGAVDFMSKPFNDQSLLDRVHQALAKDARTRRDEAVRAAIAAKVALLTPREREVMDLVVSGMSNKGIAAQLQLSAKTVETHRARVMEKMEAGSVAELVRMVLTVREPANKG
ncbi:MAG TPA: response regulator transcription factor [Phycisphaerae bacterium]|nr:response regulator transcription factor [Phycisphaerae bacterium]HRR84559.1 response regulator transcription factor [Phycisphaerae bacterium]